MVKLILAALALPALASAQTGLLVVGHGAGPAWNARVRATVAQVRWNGPVATAFLMGPEAESAGWGTAVAELVNSGARSVVVVPLMISSSGDHYRQILFYAGEMTEMPADLAGHIHGRPASSQTIPFRVTGALDDAAELGDALAEVWDSLPTGDRRRPIVFVAHGPSLDSEAESWVANIERAASRLVSRATVPHAIGLLRDDAPPAVRTRAVQSIRDAILALSHHGDDSVLVIPILISQSDIVSVTIPTDLTGLPIRYVPRALAPSVHLARWIERVALAASSPGQ